jgi:hypothetical protein
MRWLCIALALVTAACAAGDASRPHWRRPGPPPLAPGERILLLDDGYLAWRGGEAEPPRQG